MKKLKNKKIVLVIIFLILISLGMYLTHDNKSFISYIKNLLKYSENDIAYDIGPQLIETNYETDDTVIADYIIDSKYADGTQDATNVIQSALNECSKNNGGTVWLPEGKYLISGNINIPTLCTLRGDYQDPDKVENESLKYGTIIIVDTNAVSKSSINGLFSVNSSAGMIGLTIYYKGQTINNVDPYQPWTIYYADQGSLFTLKNITIINSYKGIGKNWNDSTSATQTHDMLMIENVKGTFIDTGVFLHNSSDVGVVDGLTITPDYWTNANMSILENSVSAPTYDEVIALTSNRNSAGMIITDVEQQQLSNITIEGFKYGIYFPSINYIPPRATGSGSIYNLNILNTQYGIYVERNDTETSMVDSRWGFNIANSYISGSEYSIMNKSRAVDILSEILICYSNVCKNPDNLIDDNYNNGSPNILEKTSENSQMTATFKLYDVTLDGKTYGKVLYNNNLTTGEFKYTNDDDETQDVSKKNVLDKYDAKVDKKTYGKYFKTLDTSSSVKEINDILTEAGNSGGGVVYLKAGLYNITEPLYVPSNVELRGVSSVSVKVAGISQNPNHEDGVPIGTVINVVGNTSAVVLNGDNAGVSGIYFIYEEIIKTLGRFFSSL